MSNDQQRTQQAGHPREGKPPTGEVYAFVLDPLTNHWVSQQAKDAAHAVERGLPEMRDIVQNSRIFVRRNARYMVQQGISQIIDLGSGLPTTTNTHEVAHMMEFAQEIDPPRTRVVYVDNDQQTAAKAREMAEPVPQVGFVEADICDVDAVLGDPQMQQFIDFDQPIGLVMASVIHLVSEEECHPVAGVGTRELVRRYIDAMPAGSYLAFEHASADEVPPERVKAIRDNVHAVFRSKDEIRGYFDGVRLLHPYTGYDGEPDIVHSNLWGHPEPHKADWESGKWIWAGVGIVE